MRYIVLPKDTPDKVKWGIEPLALGLEDNLPNEPQPSFVSDAIVVHLPHGFTPHQQSALSARLGSC